MPQNTPPIEDKTGHPINQGDHVWAKARGGRHEGEVEKIVTTDEEAAREGAKNPPKVLFVDQHGHYVAHNPGALVDESSSGNDDDKK